MGLKMTLFQLNQEKLNEIVENPENLFEIDPNSYNSIEIDKSWDGLKFILSKIDTNDSCKLSKIISSEQEIEDIEELVSDIYNVNFLTEEQVKNLTIELVKITQNDVIENFDFKIMNENDVYGNPFDDSSLPYLMKYFDKLKDFYSKAMNNKKAVISYIS